MKHIVYGLFDPETRILNYIGYTSRPDKRFTSHYSAKEGTKEKVIWIRSLKKRGLKPIMEVIEEYLSAEELPAGEEFWYGYFKMMGAELMNDPSCIGLLTPRPDNRGEKNGQTKLTEQQVIAIRADTRSQFAIAKEYGVGRGTIEDIKHGKTWKYLTNPIININNKYKPHSEEHKRKISNSNKGKSRPKPTTPKPNCKLCGKIALTIKSQLCQSHYSKQRRLDK